MLVFLKTGCQLAVFIGLIATVYGFWLIYHPLGYIIGGLTLTMEAGYIYMALTASEAALLAAATQAVQEGRRSVMDE